MKCPCLSTHIYSTINTSMVSDLHQMSRQPIRLHCSFLGFHSTQRHWYIQCHVQHTTNTVEHKSTTVMAEHVLAQRHTPPFLKKQTMQFHHGPVSLRRTLMLLSLYAQHYNPNKLHSENNNLGSNWRTPHHLTVTSRLNHLCSIDRRTHLLSTR